MNEHLNLLESVEFAKNPDSRCPCVLLLDTSGSMSGSRINALNDGLKIFKDALNQDDLAKKRVEVAIISFDSDVRVVQDFITADQFEPPTLFTKGVTYMGAGINKALDLIQSRKTKYKNNGVTYYRPWIFLITDGAPSDEAEVFGVAAQRIRDEENKKSLAFFAVGVEEADINTLAKISVRTPIKLKGLNFQEMFLWLSASMGRVSQSRTDEQVSLPPPSSDWTV